MVEVEYARFEFLDSKGQITRTRYGVVVNSDSHDGAECACPFQNFEDLRETIAGERPQNILDALEEFGCREEAEESGLLTLNGDYVEIPVIEEEEADEEEGGL